MLSLADAHQSLTEASPEERKRYQRISRSFHYRPVKLSAELEIQLPQYERGEIYIAISSTVLTLYGIKAYRKTGLPEIFLKLSEIDAIIPCPDEELVTLALCGDNLFDIIRRKSTGRLSADLLRFRNDPIRGLDSHK